MTHSMNRVRLYGPNDVRIEQVAIPSPGPRDVLVRIAACGICGSDLGYIAKGGLIGPSENPLALGHEFAGTLEAVGSEVQDLRPGMRVVVNPDSNLIGSGGPDGGFAPFILVRGARRDVDVFSIPDQLSFPVAALAEPLAVALHAVNRAQVTPEHKVVVFGAGSIGLGIVVGLRQQGVGNIVSVDLSDRRLALAAQLGASTTVNPARENLRETLIAKHGQGEIFGWPVVNSDVYIDAAGAGQALGQAMEMSRAGARFVIVALHKQPVPMDLVQVMAKELVITGAVAYPDEFPQAVQLLAKGDIDLRPMISHHFDFADFALALDTARDTGQAAKVVVEFPG